MKTGSTLERSRPLVSGATLPFASGGGDWRLFAARLPIKGQGLSR